MAPDGSSASSDSAVVSDFAGAAHPDDAAIAEQRSGPRLDQQPAGIGVELAAIERHEPHAVGLAARIVANQALRGFAHQAGIRAIDEDDAALEVGALRRSARPRAP